MDAIQEFIDEGLVSAVLNVVRSGKEATVYRVRAHPRLRARFAAVKVYHDINHRAFRRQSPYDDGRVILNGQVRRAVASRTEFGRQAQSAIWVDHEYESLVALHFGGASVPEPYACSGRAVLLEFIGDGSGPAPQLASVELDLEDAGAALTILLDNVETFLRENRIHADLSAYNVLWWKRRPVIIDLPQAVDARFNRNARALLERDVSNLASYFRRYRLEVDVERFVGDLWRRFTMSQL
jgi:RIO kinase 1